MNWNPFKKEKRDAGQQSTASLATQAIFGWLLGGDTTAAGEAINHSTAMQMEDVYNCVRIIAESVASLPLITYQETATGRKEAFDYPLHDLLKVAPNPEMTAFSFFEAMVGCLALTGNCYAQIQWNPRTKLPNAIYPLHPLKTEPCRVDCVLMYRTTDASPDGNWRYISSEDVVAVSLFGYDGIKGLSPIMQCAETLGLSRAALKYGARWFGKGGIPNGIMSTPDEIEDIAQKNMRESWNVAWVASIKARRHSYLEIGDTKKLV